MNSLSILKNFFIKSEASKWGHGTSLLWRGNTPSNYLNSYFRTTGYNSQFHNNFFLFESCRVGIYHYAKFLGIGPGDDVQIAAFTCDAVTKSIEALGCDITLYDCNENMKCDFLKIKSNTKLIICQVSFGVQSINNVSLDRIKKKGIPVLFDKALSYGIKDFDPNYVNNNIEVFSFEASKSYTTGWGGAIKISCPDIRKEFKNYYLTLKTVSLQNDLYRFIATFINLYMCRSGNYFKYLLWLIFRAINLHRQSKISSQKKSRKYAKPGPISKKILLSSFNKLVQSLEISNKNHEVIKDKLIMNNFKVISNVSEYCSSPRVVFLSREISKDKLYAFFMDKKIEVGFWYDELPFKNNIDNLSETKSLMKKVVNLPCHWTLTDNEINNINKMIDKVVQLNK